MIIEKDVRREDATAYARLIAHGNREPIARRRLRQILELDAPGEVVDESNKLGIWIKSPDGDYYVKDPSKSNEFSFWAPLDRIERCHDRLRVLYLGESVARGYLYSPMFTPAGYLQTVLHQATGSKDFEVVDLARTGIHLHELKKVCSAGMELQPDAMVVFAGNNWRYSLYPLTDAESRIALQVATRKERFDIIRTMLESKYATLVQDCMKFLGQLAEEHRIPVVFVIPEFNLKDWKLAENDFLLQWPNADSARWLAVKSELDAAVERGVDIPALAHELIGINSANPYGHFVLGQHYLRTERLDLARAHLEAARDTSIFRRVSRPCCITVERLLIVKESARNGIHVVDLPCVMKEDLQGGIPGNEFFLDYCHLTVDGIVVSMNHVATTLLGAMGHEAVIDPLSVTVDIDAKIQAEGHFLAAIHCAHLGDQPPDTLSFHCQESVAASRQVAEAMTHYVDMVSRKIPWVLNKSAQYFVRSGLVKQYPIVYQPDDIKIMDIDLVDAIVAAISDAELADRVRDLRVRYFGAGAEPVDLLETYYREFNYQNARRSSGFFARGIGFLSSIGRTSRFHFIAEPSLPYHFDLTCRTRLPDDAQILNVRINGNNVLEASVSGHWANLHFDVPTSMLQPDGVNMVAIDWPFFDGFEDYFHDLYADQFSGDDLVIRLSRPIYGDIQRFSARRV